jgi:hypothetical protein
MVSVASKGTFEEALILLWAMEKVSDENFSSYSCQDLIPAAPAQLYLDAWTFASFHLPSPVPSSLEPGASRALLSLIPNWSAPEFKSFVKDIAELVDELDVALDSDLGKRLAEVWKTTLWYEERFWEAGQV